MRFAVSWITQELVVAAELTIADRFAPGLLTAGELVHETDSNGRVLDRVLRSLASVWVFIGGKDGRFALIPVPDLLRTRGAVSQRDSAIMAAGNEPRSSTASFFSAGGSAFSASSQRSMKQM